MGKYYKNLLIGQRKVFFKNDEGVINVAKERMTITQAEIGKAINSIKNMKAGDQVLLGQNQ